MNFKHMPRFLTALLLCVVLAAPCLIPAQAAGPESCSLALYYAPDKLPIEDVPFQVYRVADVDMTRVRYHATEQYAGYNVLNAAGSWLDRASTLAAYVARDQLTPDAQASTDAEGMLRFESLEPGLYLITGASTARGDAVYTPTPFLLSLPNTTDGLTWEYDVETYVKHTYYIIGEPTTQCHALKVWDDAGHEDERPERVTVELLRDGVVYDSAVLSAGNNWRCDWTELPADANWQLTELTPGEDYTVSVQRSGISFVVTNTWLEDIGEEDLPLIDSPDDPGDPDDGTTFIDDEDPPLDRLPQTGLLWWPVPLLAMLGLALLCFGCVLHRRGVRDEE